MPYVFGGLVVLNAITLGYYLFIQQPTSTQTIQAAQAELTRPIPFTNNAKYIAPRIGNKE
ncbi:hypothetical protein [Psychrobacter jeotgali]|uniref:hypothetical protein n=1 Tax=Psychrobacter jeotgali TaxID=179010 RepID=UPI001917BF44|nr:hypothetical protein [Psychrobacter jeotgali]